MHVNCIRADVCLRRKKFYYKNLCGNHYTFMVSTTILSMLCTLCLPVYRRILLISIMALLPLLGGTWILGLLFLIDSDSVALAWIFTIVNSLQVILCIATSCKALWMNNYFASCVQGAAIFFFHVVRNKEVQQ